MRVDVGSPAAQARDLGDASIRTLPGGDLIVATRAELRSRLRFDDQMRATRGDPGGGWDDLTRSGALTQLVTSEYARDAWDFLVRHVDGSQLSFCRERVSSRRSAALPVVAITADMLGRAKRLAIGALLALLDENPDSSDARRTLVLGRQADTRAYDIHGLEDVRRLLMAPPTPLNATAGELREPTLGATEAPYFIGSPQAVQLIDEERYAGVLIVDHDQIEWRAPSGSRIASIRA